MRLSRLAFVVLLAVVSSPLRVDAADADGSDLWVPGLIIRSGLLVQGGDALVESTVADGVTPLRPRVTDSKTQIWPMIGVDVELMTPQVDSILGDPRFFARGGMTYSFAGDQDVAKEGNPKPFEQPFPPFASLVDGKGSKTNIELQNPVWEASLGTAFDFDVWDRRLRLRVSAEYMYQKIQLVGEVRQAVDFFGVILTSELEGSETEKFHAVGGGLGAELDAMRAGDFMTSVLMEGRVYTWVDGREVEAEDVGAFNQTGRWRYRLDPATYRLHVGFRVRWQPE